MRPIDRWILSRENRTRDVYDGTSIADRPWFSRPFWFGRTIQLHQTVGVLKRTIMYSLFDSVFDVPFGYSIPRDRVVVIPDSQYNKLRAQENERQVARLEARKEHHSQVIERLNEQIGELQAALPAAEPDKE